MKPPVKYVLYFLLGISTVALLAIVYIYTACPNVELDQSISVEITSERIKRGDYLANHVMVCIDCHAERDWTRFSGPLTTGTEGKGGEKFDRTMGLPGVYYAPNITPAGIGDWSDSELYRVITSGVNKDNEALFPLMPYMYYGQLSDEDIFSVMAYIRQLSPIQSSFPEPQHDFPMNIIVRTIPKLQEKLPDPDPSNPVEYGQYIATAAGCIECHTPIDKGRIIMDLKYSGGREFTMPGYGLVRSANITPHMVHGIGSWSKEQFINVFKAYELSQYTPGKIETNAFNTMMPWTMYAGMTTQDLGALYEYLRTLDPIDNEVIRFVPGTAADD